ncbi:hypothetical protein M3P21_11300 [Ruegeria sp. 2012CJ41-6]|uniref:DUF995 domain-containing protein n=1 Tax=Ruegeria spongiae TaxID=2942209 RepID=A0ABT0Q2L6_9RHOB|nr:hypothetical protein [Ruegeria spongiae]MCL6284116.1 hypothetical protein [Ruegeria spongiae]
MKTLFTVSAVMLAFSGSAMAAEKQIKSAADFDSKVVGKTLTYGDGTHIKIGAGSLNGKTGKGQKIKGAWNWQGKYFCRNVQIGDNMLPTDCQKVTLDGNAITFTREKGKGKASQASLQ